jgi:hypothetical protein
MVVPTRDLPAVQTALPVVRARCRDRGITTLPGVSQAVSLEQDVTARLIDADPALRRIGSEVWLVGDRGRNVVSATLRRMLALGPHTLNDLRAGIRAGMYGRPFTQELRSREALRAYARPG